MSAVIVSDSARNPLALCLSATLALAAFSPCTRAATAVVTSCDDSGPTTLRQAVADAIDGETIDLSQLACGTITLKTGEIATNLSLFITAYSDRPPATASGSLPPPPVTIDAGGNSRIFNHTGGGTLTLVGLLLQNGDVVGDGGCVNSIGSLSLRYSTVTGCHAHDDNPDGVVYGGGVSSGGTLSIDHSTLTRNRVSGVDASGGGAYVNGSALQVMASVFTNNATSDASSVDQYVGIGGGIGGYVTGDATIAYSTISGNDAGAGGGVALQADAITITASTLSDNHSYISGGAQIAAAALKVYNSTIALNASQATRVAGGITFLGTTIIVSSSILALNTVASTAMDLSGVVAPYPVVAGSNNLVMASSLQLPADTIVFDPMLAPLADNGGPTPTRALLPGSPAIDHGVNTLNLQCDQRYSASDCYMRWAGAHPDIGAYEFGARHDKIFAGGFELPEP